MEATPEAKLLVSQDFVNDLTEQVRHANKRIVIFSHIIAYDDSTEKLIDELCAAADRGVSVDVAGDVFTFGILKAWTILTFRPNQSIRRLRQMTKRFKRHGIRYRWIGQFGPFLFAGRTHVKWVIIDDIVYSFGGVNLYDKGIQAADFAIKLHDETIAKHLIKEHGRIARADQLGRFYRAHARSSRYGKVLIDGGRILDSIIYSRACKLAEKATSILFVSQYCPTGKLGKIMSTKDTQLYFSHWKIADGANRFLIRTSMAKTKYRTLYTRKKYIHAKFIIFTMADGSRVALTGSHNFVWGGVVLGTREIDLETYDDHIIDQLEDFFQHHIA